MAWQGLFTIVTLLFMQRGISVSSQSPDVQPAKSLCRQYHRINVTKEMTYMKTYHRYDEYDDWTGSNLASRIDTVTKWAVVEMCCEGYEPSHDDQSPEQCVPVCPSECRNGVCQRPNSCLCDPGYVASVDNVTRISECLPKCSSGCVGGICIAPETCSCTPGYDLVDNSTSCKPSCNSFTLGGVDNCGIGGICVAPNKCQCRDGYSYDHHADIIDCIPICEPKCPTNSECINPNRCYCNLGYKPNDWFNVTECLPECDQPCHNGFCKRPNECQCYDGYKAHESLGTIVCEPACQEVCVNGKCILPNQCECLPGYKKLIVQSANEIKVSPNICIPICAGECGKGTCVAPYKCHCNPGYEVLYFPYTLSQTCRPICNPRCSGESKCVAPNHCQLHDIAVAKYPSYQARIVEFSPKECGHNGSFSKINGTCMCNYQSDTRECTEPLLCAIIIVNDTESVKEFRLLEKVIFHNKTINGPESYRSKMACRNECRISIFSNETLENIRNDIEQCYTINLHDAKTGIVFNITENLVPISGKKTNESFICFVNAGFRCNISKDEERKTGGVVSTDVIAGAVFLVVVVFVLTLLISLAQRKKWKLFGVLPRKNETMMERSEVMDSPFHTDDSSHL